MYSTGSGIDQHTEAYFSIKYIHVSYIDWFRGGVYTTPPPSPTPITICNAWYTAFNLSEY